jgi:hypothetical protein
MSTSRPLHVVSVSIGSSSRDKRVTARFFDRDVIIERRGTDGDMARAIALIGELDGHVDAIGLGGIDLYLVAAGHRYVIQDALRMARAAKVTPVVDGSGLKHTLERRTLLWLQEHGVIDFKGKRVLLVSAVDRFGMAEVLPELGAQSRYGDLIFAIGVPIALTTLSSLNTMARILLPIITRLPFKWIYPTGTKQESTQVKHSAHFDWADIIAGDFHFIRRYMPSRLDGKIIITNTTTASDVALLRERGAALLIGTTPAFDGRSFGTNVMEGVITALLGKRPEELTPEDFLTCLDRLGWSPQVVRLQE